MVTLDKLKIVAPLSVVENWRFNHETFKGEEERLPYHLYIKRDNVRATVTIDFTGKILLDEYPDLINRNNIHTCFERINSIGFCRLNADRIITEGKVVAADFTKDVLITEIHGVGNINALKSIVHLSINNYRRWSYYNYRASNGVVVTNTTRDPRYNRRLTIYNKSHELDLCQNRGFMDALQNPQQLRDYFNGRARFELNATTQYQLCKWLDIHDTRLHSVLHATTNPLKTVMQEMFRPICAVRDRDIPLRDQDRIALLKLLDWNLAGVEAHVREHTNRSITQSMRPYRELYALHHNVDIRADIDIVEYVE